MDTNGIFPQLVPVGCRHTYFLYLFRLDLDYFGCSAAEFADAVSAEGVPAKAGMITGGRPVYHYDLFRNRSAFPQSTWPFQSLDTGVDRVYRAGDCPVAEAAFGNWLTMDLHEHYTDTDVEEIAFAIEKVACWFAAKKNTQVPVVAEA